LEGFPLLRRLSTIIIANNYIRTIGEKIGDSLPNLENLILTNNRISNLIDLDPFESLTKLKSLILNNNPVIHKRHYRLYVINKLPNLRILDYKKVSHKEREEAKELFGGQAGEQLKTELERSKTLARGTASKGSFTPEEKELIKKTLDNISSPSDIQKLEVILRSGKIPPNLPEKFGITIDTNTDSEAMEIDNKNTNE